MRDVLPRRIRYRAAPSGVALPHSVAESLHGTESTLSRQYHSTDRRGPVGFVVPPPHRKRGRPRQSLKWGHRLATDLFTWTAEVTDWSRPSTNRPAGPRRAGLPAPDLLHRRYPFVGRGFGVSLAKDKGAPDKGPSFLPTSEVPSLLASARDLPFRFWTGSLANSGRRMTRPDSLDKSGQPGAQPLPRDGSGSWLPSIKRLVGGEAIDGVAAAQQSEPGRGS
jgi:hypothetical protein